MSVIKAVDADKPAVKRQSSIHCAHVSCPIYFNRICIYKIFHQTNRIKNSIKRIKERAHTVANCWVASGETQWKGGDSRQKLMMYLINFN